MNAVDPFAAAIAIARGSGSPMERAAAALDRDRYNVFCATYASMRVIDDFVDDRFLALKDRAPARADAARTVEAWREAAIAALTEGRAPAADDPFVSTHGALAATHGVAAVDPSPWQGLAGAMQRDVDEAPMENWADFLAYAEGATAAPAAVFIEILALEPGDGKLRSRLDGPAIARIRNSAILLYLVHIMRDLAEDAAKGPHLLTLPDAMFRGLGLTKAGFAEDAGDDAAIVRRVQAEIAGYAQTFLLPALGELTALDADLAPADAAILRGLCEPYIERYEQFAETL